MIVEELLAPDAVIHGLGEQGLAVRGPKAFLSFFATMRSAFPDIHVQALLAQLDAPDTTRLLQ